MWTETSGFFRLQPSSAPELTFFYKPYDGYQQKKLRREFHQSGDTYAFMRAVVRSRIALVQESTPTNTYTYCWPDQEYAQDHLFSRFSQATIIEIGATLLGWVRSEDEDPQHFVNRVVKGLEEALY